MEQETIKQEVIKKLKEQLAIKQNSTKIINK